MSDSGKKTPILLFVGIFIVIIAMMFVANSKTELLYELKPPRGGVENLYSKGNSLIAVSRTNNISIWNWNDLEARPFETSIQADKSTILSEDTIAWIPLAKPDTIVLTDIKTKKEKHKLRLPYNQKCQQLSASSNGKYVAMALIDKKDDSEKPANIRLEMIPQDFSQLKHILTIQNHNDKVSMRSIAIADNGQFIAIAGKKNDDGWITLIDIASKKQLWQLGSELSPELTELAFSPDSDTIYTAGVGMTVYAIEIETGQILHTFQMDDYKIQENKRRIVTCITIDHSGHLIAAGTEPVHQFYVWDIQTDKKVGLFQSHTGNSILSDIAFSSDLKTVAMSNLVSIHDIQIWELSDNSDSID